MHVFKFPRYYWAIEVSHDMKEFVSSLFHRQITLIQGRIKPARMGGTSRIFGM